MPGKRTKVQAPQSPPEPKYGIGRSKLHFAPPQPLEPPKEKPPREKRKAVKNDPRLVAAARELRDRWLEQFNQRQLVSNGKYDVCRTIGSETTVTAISTARHAPVCVP